MALVAHKAYYKLVMEMHYKGRVQAIATYYTINLQTKINKPEARNMRLTREQYLLVNIEQ